MRSLRLARIAVATATSLAFCMPAYAGFRAKEFLQWGEKEKSSYIQIVLMTANTIASQNDKDQSKCIGNWFDSDRNGNERYILEVMGKNPTQHPLAVIIAIAERKCGSFQYRKP